MCDKSEALAFLELIEVIGQLRGENLYVRPRPHGDLGFARRRNAAAENAHTFAGEVEKDRKLVHPLIPRSPARLKISSLYYNVSRSHQLSAQSIATLANALSAAFSRSAAARTSLRVRSGRLRASAASMPLGDILRSVLPMMSTSLVSS